MTVAKERQPAAGAKRWPIRRSAGGWLGLGATLALFALGLALLWLATRDLGGVAQLVGLFVGAGLVGLSAAVGIAAVGFFRLAYELRADRLVVRGGGQTETILLDDVEGIYAGQRVGTLTRVRGLTWPGYYVGIVRGRGLGTMRVYCTDRQVESLSIVVTAERTYVLTPADPPAFRRELIRRIEASTGATLGRAATSTRRAWLPSPAVAGCFVAAAALLATATTALQLGYPGLPETIALQPEPPGRPPALLPREQVVSLPLVGAAALILNLLFVLALRGRAVAASVLLAGSSALVAAVVMLSALRVLAR